MLNIIVYNLCLMRTVMLCFRDLKAMGTMTELSRFCCRDAIVNYVHKKMNLTVKALMSKSDAESLMVVQSPIVVAYLQKIKVQSPIAKIQKNVL